MNPDDILPWFKHYQSTSRHLYRNCWFIKFLNVLCTLLREDRTMKLSKAG